MDCEICGFNSEKLYLIEIEGSKLMACANCRNAGKLLEETTDAEKGKALQKAQKPFAEKPWEKVLTQKPFAEKPFFVRHARQPKDEIKDFTLVEDYNIRISKARQKLGLTIKELSEKVFEKESVLHKIESGKMKPEQKLKERLEKFLNIKLEEKAE